MPRRKPTVAGARFSIFTGIALGVAILVSCLWIGSNRYRAGTGLLDHGRRATATVESKHRYKRVFDVWVDYDVDGRAFRNEVNVRSALGLGLDVGHPVPIVYLPEDPRVSAITPEDLRDNGRELLILALPGALLIGGVCVGSGLWELRTALGG